LTTAEYSLPPGTPAEPPPPARWWADHYDEAAQQIIDFLDGAGVPLAGCALADVGSGDGIIDLGVLHKAEPARITGYDVNPTDRERLGEMAREAGADVEIPGDDRLTFVESGARRIPAADASFDVVYSWSTFEHVSHPTAMLAEIRRVLRDTGALFLQIWPLFHSLHGGHLWYSIRESFPHLRYTDEEIRERVQGKPSTDPRRDAWDEFQSLNKLTLDELDRSLLTAGLRVAKVELMSETVTVPSELGHVPLSALAISGVKLLAVPN
jgi:SAM-dependent methyltransferase